MSVNGGGVTLYERERRQLNIHISSTSWRPRREFLKEALRPIRLDEFDRTKPGGGVLIPVAHSSCYQNSVFGICIAKKSESGLESFDSSSLQSPILGYL